MDFFAQQERTRRNTTWLAVFFLLAVAGIVLAVDLAAMLVFSFANPQSATVPQGPVLWNAEMLAVVTAATLGLIGLGCFYKFMALKAGGRAVAEMLGGRLIQTAETAEEKRLCNVVEEMALAAGIPVPAVYVLDQEEGINAFAAGLTTADAVIGVTTGCLKTFSRDELQGVIGHEFSHILNGDMRLNLRLLALLHGILLIALTGYIVLRVAGRSSGRGSSKKGGGAVVAILAFALTLVVIGYVGVFFARLIQRAVSRQREFLADASAVQFTRNPLGIGAALKKILASSTGTALKHPQTQAVSHLLFGAGLARMLSGLFATHPPLSERIARIDAGLLRDLNVKGDQRVGTLAPGAAMASSFAGTAETIALQPWQVVQSAGNPQPRHIAHAEAFLRNLPEELQQWVREPFSAQAVVFAVLFDGDHGSREVQLRELSRHIPPPLLDLSLRCSQAISPLGPRARLPLVDLALPALRRMSPGQSGKFMQAVNGLTDADLRVSLFEFVLQRILQTHLLAFFGNPPARPVRFSALKPLLKDCHVLLSALARAGAADETRAALAVVQGFSGLSPERVLLLPAQQTGAAALGAALDRLGAAAPAIKRQLIEAAAATVISDGKVTVEEAELLRAIADTLHCPVPPLHAV